MLKAFLINIIWLGVAFNIVAQDLTNQKKYADSLFISENYFDAVTEYKRLLYFDKSEDYNFEANYKIGLSYKAGAKFDEAVRYLSLAEKYCDDELNIVNIELEIIKSNILRGTIPEAINRLEKLQKRYNAKIDSSETHYWRGWAYLISDDWESAATEFSMIDLHHPLKMLADRVEYEKYSVTLAKAVSYIIPGSGQFYTGNYLSGIMSLGWNVLWGYLTINAFVTERAVEGILIGGLLWARFYRGNVQNAEKFAIKKNKEISNKAYHYLSKEYMGKKP
jgi:tetratricopeptide (TPR) repeat protein